MLRSRPFSFENKKKVYAESNHDNKDGLAAIGNRRDCVKRQSYGLPIRPIFKPHHQEVEKIKSNEHVVVIKEDIEK